jgi:hypothetical protein
VAQHEQRRLVGPVDVVEDDQQGLRTGGLDDRARDSVDDPEPVLRRCGVGRRNLGGVQCTEHLAPRPERRRTLGVDAAPPGGGRLRRAAGDLLCQAGLADARFPDDEHEPSVTRDRGLEPRLQLGQLQFPAEQRRADRLLARRHAGQHAAPEPGLYRANAAFATSTVANAAFAPSGGYATSGTPPASGPRR